MNLSNRTLMATIGTQWLIDEGIADQGRTMARRLEQQKKAVTYIEVEHGGHSMTNTAARQEILVALEIFLAENLGEN